jgi:hypothetical protein
MKSASYSRWHSTESGYKVQFLQKAISLSGLADAIADKRFLFHKSMLIHIAGKLKLHFVQEKGSLC